LARVLKSPKVCGIGNTVFVVGVDGQNIRGGGVGYADDAAEIVRTEESFLCIRESGSFEPDNRVIAGIDAARTRVPG